MLKVCSPSSHNQALYLSLSLSRLAYRVDDEESIGFKVGLKLILAAATLHCQHNISGLRVGTLPGVSQQNGFLGLPMTLMQEETAHLVKSGEYSLSPLSLLFTFSISPS